MIYARGDSEGNGPAVLMYKPTGRNGVFIRTGHQGITLPDDEIPNLISALQDYMSRRAREMAKGANGNG
jgi:hypothetical protein